jgi:hypothetical protein
MKATEAKKLLFVLPFLKYFFPLSCFAFKHRNCRRAISVQFQFPDCFIPSMNPYMLLSEASFLMSHDAATGYLTSKRGVSGISGATNLYAKNQRGSVYDQLNNGARALDVRPRLLQNGTVLLHHGAIGISVTLKTLVLDAIRWCNENPDELVLIFHSNLVYQQNVQPDADTAANALSQVYNRLGVAYAECDDIYGATVQETMEMAELSSGGYLLALDRHDAYASFCGKSNYIGDQIVTCYPNNTLPCTNSKSPSHSMLKDYVLACANNDASDSSYVLGPPESLCDYPFNSIQGLWQVDTHSAAMGVAHVSSIIDDNTKSRINADLVDWIYNGEFDAISLLMVDHVALNGNALLSVLRNTCGQSELADDSCGMAISKPRIKQKLMSTLSFSVTIAVYLGFLVWIAVMFRHYKTYYQHEHQMQRMKDDLKAAERQVQNVMACGVLT